MATKPTVKFTAPAVMSMTEVSKLKQADAVKLFGEKSTVQSRLFMELAKIIVHLETTLTKSQTIYGVLLKSGVRQASIANAMQAARVFKEYVKPGHWLENVFDSMSYADCVAVNAVGKLRGIEYCISADLSDIHHINDHGMTESELKKAEADKAAKLAADAKAQAEREAAAKLVQTAATVATPAPTKATVVPPPAPSVIVAKSEVIPVAPATALETKSTTIELTVPPTLRDGEKLLAELEKTFTHLSPEDLCLLCDGLCTLTDFVVEQVSQYRGKLAGQVA